MKPDNISNGSDLPPDSLASNSLPGSITQPGLPTDLPAQPYDQSNMPSSRTIFDPPIIDVSTPSSVNTTLPNQPEAPKPPKPRRKTKIAAIAAGLVILLGGAAGYFGYYAPNQPGQIWARALVNTGKGYDKLAKYAAETKNAKGVTIRGSMKFTGSLAFDGTFSGSSNDYDGQLQGSLSAAGIKINFAARSLKSAMGTPDIYFKVDGLQGLGTLLGPAFEDMGFTEALNGLNNQWYFIDHTLFDQFASGANTSLQITAKDVSSVLEAVGKSGKQYIFTSDSKKMVLEAAQNIGKEKQDGRNVYHYKAKINKQNLKNYLASLCTNLKASKLTKFFAGSDSLGSALHCNQTSQAVERMNTTGSVDVWVDTGTKLIHKVRFSQKNQPGNYMEVGQAYAGGNKFPFSIGFQSKDSDITNTGSLTLTLDIAANTLTLKGTIKESSGNNEDNMVVGSFDMTITPNNLPVKVEKPSSAKTLVKLLNDLGLASLFANTPTTGTSAQARDTERKSDMRAIQSKVAEYYALNGVYPLKLGDISGLSDDACQGPEENGSCAKPDYTYKPFKQGSAISPSSNINCDNAQFQCQDYIIYSDKMETTANPHFRVSSQ